MKYLKIIVSLLLPTIFLIGCEKQEYFKSEDTIQSELQHTWHRVQISHNDSPSEYWIFKDGKVSIANDTLSAGLEGEYSVKTTLTKVFITTKNFHSAAATYYDGCKWQVIKLDGSVLCIAGEDPNTGALMQREFTR
jgi:hypothetical protein